MLLNNINLVAMCLFCSTFCTLNLSANTVVTTSDNQRLAVGLVEELLDMLKNESQLTYDKGQYFFRGMTYLEFNIMEALGYQDQAGKWLKPKPSQSYLGSLLLMKKKLILPSSSEDNPCFSVVDIDDPEGAIYDRIKVVVIYGRDMEQMEYCSEEQHRTLVFTVWCEQDNSKKLVKIDLMESYIDGINIAYFLGFRLEKKEVKYGKRIEYLALTYYPKDKLRELEAFVEKFVKKKK